MNKKHLTMLYPQWQGGGKNKATYDGAMMLKQLYLNGIEHIEIPVSLEEDEPVAHGIWGYQTILEQMQSVRQLLNARQPTTLFTIGGGDGVEILPVSYINEQMNGYLSVLFFDAHGDLNTPETSPSQKLHGMPLRTLLGDGDKRIVGLLYRPLRPEQVLMVGTRDCDAAEYSYIDEKQMQVISSKEANSCAESVLTALRAMNTQNVYIHIDIDVLDPCQFPYQPVPAPNGMNIDALTHILKCVQKEFHIVGMCLLGCCATGTIEIDILQEIIHMGNSLDQAN